MKLFIGVLLVISLIVAFRLKSHHQEKTIQTEELSEMDTQTVQILKDPKLAEGLTVVQMSGTAKEQVLQEKVEYKKLLTDILAQARQDSAVDINAIISEKRGQWDVNSSEFKNLVQDFARTLSSENDYSVFYSLYLETSVDTSFESKQNFLTSLGNENQSKEQLELKKKIIIDLVGISDMKDENHKAFIESTLNEMQDPEFKKQIEEKINNQTQNEDHDE